ncbi:MAG: phosphate ABC transporter permease subunit PstC [Hyphomonas sp.]|nr:phosphate ABC transporter permease subunit PstC [Hyphomonas sp.]
MLSQLGHLPMDFLLVSAMIVLASAGFIAGRLKAESFAFSPDVRVHSRPNSHGFFVLMWALGPALLVALGYAILSGPLSRAWLQGELPSGFSSLRPGEMSNYLDAVARAGRLEGFASGERVFDTVTARYVQIRGEMNLAALALAVLLPAACLAWAHRRIGPDFRARVHVESGIEWFLFLCAAVAIATTVGIVASLVFESLRFFAAVPVQEFLLGREWNAQTSAEFGALPLFFGTFMIAFFAMLVAAPVGLYAAIYLSEYAGRQVRAVVKPVMEVLAGIPTVVYGFFALLVVAPLIRAAAVQVNGTLIQLGWASEPVFAAQPTSALAAGVVMGIMVIPFVSSLSDDVIRAVPQALRDGAYAVGATKSEAVRQVVLPAALPGIIAALLLAVSRAIGETMIVVMAAGHRAQISLDPTQDLTTITVQIVALLTGESGFDSPKTLSAFALGLALFAFTLVFNLVALGVVQRFRQKYE